MEVIFRVKEGNRDRWEILIDGQEWLEVHRTIFGRHPVFPSFSNDTDLVSLFNVYEYRRVRAYVLWRLSSQSYHSQQLIKVLHDRLVQSQTIERVIDEFRNMGFLDDESWLENFIRSRQKRYSLRYILNKLQSKGISSEIIQRLASEWNDPNEELEVVRHLIKTRYRSKDLSDFKTRQKVIASLARKGYPFDQIQAAIREERLGIG